MKSSQRLHYRPVMPGDEEDLQGIFGDPEVMRFSLSGAKSPEEIRQYIKETWVHHPTGTGQWLMILRDSGLVAGVCGFFSFEHRGNRELEISYRLKPPFWGQGLATEAALALVEHAESRLSCRRLYGVVDPDNGASAEVLRKVGLLPEGDLEYHGRRLHVYGMTLRRGPGIPDEELIHEGPMTGREVRMMILGLLSPGPEETVLDVGAGSGAVGLELAPFVRRVYAVEKDPVRVETIRRNRQRRGTENLTVLSGSAPGILETLPETPDHIFVGGSSRDLTGLLDWVDRVQTESGSPLSLLFHFVTPEHLVEIRSQAASRGYPEPEVLMVNLARGIPGREGGTRFHPDTPQFLVLIRER